MRAQQRQGLVVRVQVAVHVILILAFSCSGLPCYGAPSNHLRPPSTTTLRPSLHFSARTPVASLRACRGGDGDAPSNQTTIMQIIGGAALIFAAERSIWAFGEYIVRRPIPSAPTGMMLVFFVLVVSHAVAPSLTSRVANWFAPSITELLKLVPLFFSPPLVQLPLALAPLAPSVILKMLAAVVSGSLIGVAATGMTIQLLWGTRGAEVTGTLPPSPSIISAASSATLHPKQHSSTARIATAVGILGVSWAVAIGRVSVHATLVLLLSAAAVELGSVRRAPASLSRAIPPILTSSALTCGGVLLLGLLHGQPPLDALQAYRTGSGGFFGGPGVGDWLFACAPAVIVSLGFRLFEQRFLLAQHLAPLLGGSALNCLLSLSYTLAASRLLRVPPIVGRSLVARFISLPFAVPLAAALQATVPLAALATCIQGPVAAAFGFQLLDACGVRSVLARGVAIGGSAHALGTATAAAVEPSIAPAAALAFMLSGTFMSVFFLAPCAAALNALFEH